MYPLCGALSFPALASNWSCYLHPRSTPPSPGEKRASRPPPARPLCSWGGWSPPSSKPGCSYPPPLRKQFTCALARAKAVLIAACRKFNGLPWPILFVEEALSYTEILRNIEATGHTDCPGVDHLTDLPCRSSGDLAASKPSRCCDNALDKHVLRKACACSLLHQPQTEQPALSPIGVVRPDKL